MIFSDKLYADEKLSKDYRTVLRRVRDEKIPLTWFLIARPQSGRFPFNIYPAYLLREPYYRDLQETVIGVASSKDEAIALAGILAVHEQDADSFLTVGESRDSAAENRE